MRVTIYQPQFFPRLHYFNRILTSDAFVILDSAQYTKSLVHLGKTRKRHKSYQADTPIKLASGVHLLTVPIKHQGFLPIRDTHVDNLHKWIPKHLAALRTAYGRTPRFAAVSSAVKELYSDQVTSLGNLNTRTICWALARLLELEGDPREWTVAKINTHLAAQTHFRLKRLLTDRETGVARPEGAGQGTAWTTTILKTLGATEYLHGATAKHGYMDQTAYERVGVTPVLQDWRCPQYPQQFTDKIGFLPNLSILDLLFNVGPAAARGILYP